MRETMCVCPQCSANRSKVIDSRFKSYGVYRRRECLSCNYRFTSHEIIIETKENNQTDTERLNFLQSIMVDNGEYTGKCILRLSTRNKGWRLYETNWQGGSNNVRDQIDKAMNIKII